MAECDHNIVFLDERGEPVGGLISKRSYCDLCGRTALNVKAGASVRDDTGCFTVLCWDCFALVMLVDAQLDKSEWCQQNSRRRYCADEVINVMSAMHLPEHIPFSNLIVAIRCGIGFPVHKVLEEFDHNETLAAELVRSSQRYFLKHGTKRMISAELINGHMLQMNESEQKCFSSAELQQFISCDNCCKRMQHRLRCGRCKLALYCNRDCQRAHWSLHKPYCLDIRKLVPTNTQ